MLLGFLRHAEAEDQRDSDFERRLTAKGLEQAAKVAKFCLRNGLLPDLILSSPVARARSTAEIVAKASNQDLVIAKWLACGMTPDTCRREIPPLAENAFVLLVGHEPDFSRSIASLLALPDPGSLKIRKASLTVLEVQSSEPCTAQLQFSLPARLM